MLNRPGVNDSNSEHTIPSSEYVYVVLTAVTSGLSIFGGTCICVLYFAFKDLRSAGRKLLFFLAFSDAMLALGNLLGIIWYLYSDSAIINKSEGYCDFQSAMTIYFSMTSFAWTVTMATSLFATVVLNKQIFTVTYMKLFHILAWIPAGLITIIALSMDVLGTDTTLEQASWCWIDPRVPNALLWQFVTGKFFEIIAYITTVVLYAAIKIFLVRQANKKIGNISGRKSRSDRIAEANRKLTFVPLVFIVCRIWGTVRFLIGNFGEDIVNEPYVTWINPLQGIGDSVQGFANFVLYCFSTRTIRRRMFPCSNKVQDVSLYNSNSKTENTVPASKKNAVAPSSFKQETIPYSTDINDSVFCVNKTSPIDSAKPSTYKISVEENMFFARNANLERGMSEISSRDIPSTTKSESEIGVILQQKSDVTMVVPINSTPFVSKVQLEETDVAKESKQTEDINSRENRVVHFQLDDSSSDTEAATCT